jgi:hypothetical protein
VKAATSWPFVVSLVVLLLNDLYLKAAFSNWVTGKLSDLAGVFLISVLTFSLVPRGTVVAAILLAASFAFWKSPASQPLIEAAGALGVAKFGRVVDYSDLAALMLLPVAYRVARDIDRYQFAGAALRRALSVPIFATALLAVMGTSVIPYQDHYSIRRPDHYQAVDGALAAQVIAEVANKHALRCVACENASEKAEYRGQSLSMSYRIIDRRVISFSVEGYPGLLFGDDRSRMLALRRDLQQELGTRIPNLEFVLPLPENVRRQ